MRGGVGGKCLVRRERDASGGIGANRFEKALTLGEVEYYTRRPR